MKKTNESETPWIKHDRNECPIPWAKVGEFEILDQFDKKKSWGADCNAADLCWAPGFSFRLTNGWIYVKGDGTIPEAIRGAKAGEWKLRYRHGEKIISTQDPEWWQAGGKHNNNFYHSGYRSEIVAVRLVKNASATHCKFCDVEIDNDVGAKEVCCEVCCENYEMIAGPINSGPQIPVVAMKTEAPLQETEKQRLTHEAWQRYKTKHPDPVPVLPLGECAMIEIAAKALDAFEEKLISKRRD